MALPLVSVVVPARDAAVDIAACVRAVTSQSVPRTRLEVIVVDDGSRDGTGAMAAAAGARVLHSAGCGAPTARNVGLKEARGTWVAFTDADCRPTRRWLAALLAAVETGGDAVGAAGATMGFDSAHPAARYVDLTRGLDAERHLAHPRWPFAPTANVMYRRERLLAVGGFDERYAAYDACDLHARLAPGPAAMRFAPTAVVLHRHRPDWPGFVRQQIGYGRGLAQFALRWRNEVGWHVGREAAAWGRLLALAIKALPPGSGNSAIVRRGHFLKALGQRVGFSSTYWSRSERHRWPEQGPARLGLFGRIRSKVRSPSDLVLLVRIAVFLMALRFRLSRRALPDLLDAIANAPRPVAQDARAAAERIARLRSMVCGLPGLRRYNTCFARALVLFRFIGRDVGEVVLRLVVEEARSAGDRLRSHAWVTVGDIVLEEPELAPERLRELYRFVLPGPATPPSEPKGAVRAADPPRA